MKIQILITEDLGDEEVKLDFHINGTNEEILRIKNKLEKAIKMVQSE